MVSQSSSCALLMVGASLLALSFATPGTANAAEEGAAVAEIIVTAQKREERLKDVPIAISVVSAETLERKAVKSLSDLSGIAPNFRFEERGSEARDQRLVVRGISSDTGFVGQDSAVGLVIDGVYISGVSSLNTGVIDIQQVEILRGPQGTLFGRNTTGGVINITTRRPGPDREFRGVLEGGNYDYRSVKLSASGPLVDDRVFGGVSLLHLRQDGFLENPYDGGDMGSKNAYAARLDFVFAPTEAWDFRLVGEYQWDDYRMSSIDPTPFDRVIESDAFTPTAHRQVYAAAFTATRTFANGFELRSITSARHRRPKEMRDGDAFNLPVAYAIRRQRERGNEYAQELQISSPSGQRLEWLAGFYVQRETIDFQGRYSQDIDFYWDLLLRPRLPGRPSLREAYGAAGVTDRCNLPAPACSYQEYSALWSYDTKTAAAFGNLKYDLTERLNVQLGGRLSWERKDFLYDAPVEAGFRLPSGNAARVIFAQQLATNRSTQATKFTPRASVGYQLSEAHSAYLSAAQGYKSGYFYGNLLGISDVNNNGENDFLELLEVDPETAWTYEAGLKGSFGGTLNYTLAAYFIDYKGLQTRAILFNPVIPNATFNYLQNADTESYGVEAEFSSRVTDALSLYGGVAFNHAEYVRYPNCALQAGVGTLDCRGKTVPFAPRWTASARADYRQPIPGTSVQVIASVDANYRSRQYFDVLNALSSEGYVLVNGAIGVEAEDGAWSLVAFGKNITDKDYISHRFSNGGIIGAPRTYGVRLSVRY